MTFSLLICNGEMPGTEVLRHLAGQARSIVCADGGANAARAAGVLPATVIGDFDSINEETREEFSRRGVEMLRLERQDDTDFEKALKLLVQRGCERVVILGLTGKLLDHTLGNFSILLRYVHQLHVAMFDSDYRMDVLTSSGSYRSASGDRISVVPLPAAQDVHYEGLEYPLDGEELSFGNLEGTCNTALGERFEIRFSRGVLLLFRSLHPDLYHDLQL